MSSVGASSGALHWSGYDFGTSRNLAPVRLVENFSPIKAIFRRNTCGISREINAEWGKKHSNMTGDRFLEVPIPWDIESGLIAQGYDVICGVDEAGRGPLAGPVVAAAVILPHKADIHGLYDSKKLSENMRERLYQIITDTALAYAVASAEPSEIDEYNILNATFMAMNRAIEKLAIKADIAIIDGSQCSGIMHRCKCIVRGDSKSPSIAAASIIAKVSRDRYMMEMSSRYPEYGFEKHKGYGTKLHYEKLRTHGISEIHRRTFLKRVH